MRRFEDKFCGQAVGPLDRWTVGCDHKKIILWKASKAQSKLKKIWKIIKNMFYYRKNSEILGKILKIHDFEIKHDFE